MPDGSKVVFHSNWRTGPAWETLHLTELGHLLDMGHRAWAPRVIAGVSMAGLGALGYAARHPGMFTVAASFSGIVDTRLSDDEAQAYLGLVQSPESGPTSAVGDPTRDAAVWKAHNPYDLAPRLRGTKLFVSAETAAPARSPPARQPRPDRVGVAHRERRVRAAPQRPQGRYDGAPVPAGTHNWVYWQRELTNAWP